MEEFDTVGSFTREEAEAFIAHQNERKGRAHYRRIPVVSEIVQHEDGTYTVISYWSQTTQLCVMEYGGYNGGVVRSRELFSQHLNDREYETRREEEESAWTF